ncbi:unnamed protein product [Porites evermanni]|uniref:Uncharacterized protein n=1 Tax=Porites evermanni TaxID=104178 RepID=A0ABN8LDH8_9CNID|nr:unnamed protein product [Porites evermanni]
MRLIEVKERARVSEEQKRIQSSESGAREEEPIRQKAEWAIDSEAMRHIGCQATQLGRFTLWHNICQATQREKLYLLEVFQSDPLASSHKVMWEDQTIQFDGMPYFVLGQKIFDCRNGKDRKEACRKQKVSKSK